MHLEKDAIFIVEYDKNWPRLAIEEIKKIYNVVNDNNLVDVQHIGSTSIPGAMAKPIIDIYMGVHSINTAKEHYLNSIFSLGYDYWDENPNPDKLFFVKGLPPAADKRTHHIHVVKHNSVYWRDRIAFRDYLRAHPDEVQHYSALKVKLALKYPYDRETYTDQKNPYIVRILKKAGINNGGQR